MNRRLQNQAGFSLITALFIVVILAMLGAYMAQLSSAQHTESAMAVQGQRAWYAAYSGLEWAGYRIENDGACPSVPSNFTVEGFAVQLTQCTRHDVTEGGASFAVFDVSLTASRGSFGSVDYVSRTLRATLGGL